MKNGIVVVVAGVLAFGLVSCSSKDVKPVSDGVVDASMRSDAPVKVSGAIDAGMYRENESYTDIGTHGGANATILPTMRFYAVDREKNAPVNKLLYVLTDESPAHCIKGKFVTVEGKKKLVVYSKSPVPSNYCVYQKNFSSEPEGFSLSVEKGGVCKPSAYQVSTDDQKRKMASVEPVSHIVPMSYCVENTFSYGEEASRH